MSQTRSGARYRYDLHLDIPSDRADVSSLGLKGGAISAAGMSCMQLITRGRSPAVQDVIAGLLWCRYLWSAVARDTSLQNVERLRCTEQHPGA